VPALRDHSADIPFLVEQFLRAAGHAGPVSTVIPPDGIEALAAYRWPGNIRELKNLVEASLAMGEALTPPPDLAPSVGSAGGDLIAAVLGKPYGEARGAVVDAFERRYLEALMQKTRGNISAAAREADIDRSHLTDLLKRYAIR
jgi:DNA-binding NtrC family response regulator